MTGSFVNIIELREPLIEASLLGAKVSPSGRPMAHGILLALKRLRDCGTAGIATLSLTADISFQASKLHSSYCGWLVPSSQQCHVKIEN